MTTTQRVKKLEAKLQSMVKPEHVAGCACRSCHEFRALVVWALGILRGWKRRRDDWAQFYGEPKEKYKLSARVEALMQAMGIGR